MRRLAEIPDKGFSPKRGKMYFLVALVVGPIVVGINVLSGSPASFTVAVAFVIGAAVLAGVIGMFTDNIGF